MTVDHVVLPVILIGPVNAGKSTLAPLLAERLGADHVSLDDVCWRYLEDAGYDAEIARECFKRAGQAGALEYTIQFYPSAIERVIAEYPDRVIELGAGHSVYDDSEKRAAVKGILSAHPNVVLILPAADPDESIRILNARESNPHPDIVAMNEHFVRSPSNSELATITIYTQGCTPAQSCEGIVSRLMRV